MKAFFCNFAFGKVFTNFKNLTYLENCWDFDRLAKTDKIYSQIWYDSHSENEDNFEKFVYKNLFNQFLWDDFSQLKI